MQVLITLGLAFSVLVTYLENTILPEQVAATPPSDSKVIRTANVAKIEQPPKPVTATNATEKTVELVRAIIPLDLSIPVTQNTETFKFQHSKPAIDLFHYSGKPEVTYNAELVYDAEKGEDITGGKINIRIPLG